MFVTKSIYAKAAKYWTKNNVTRHQSIETAKAKVAKYWTENNVTQHQLFKTAEESIDSFHWRTEQYQGYLELLPVANQDNKVVLDYGCGPGHDLVGFSVYSKPSRLIGMDVSSSSLAEARFRLALHGSNAEFILLNPEDSRIPLEDNSVDYIHSSGVLHHVPDLISILKEFKRILRPNGKIRVMVYHYDSIFFHLYVGYQKKIVEQLFQDLTVREAFAKLTDGPNCPISNIYTPDEFIPILNEGGFTAEFLGAGISMYEASLFFSKRYDAIVSKELSRESRKFLLDLELDHKGFPKYKGTYAGVDGCYELRPK